MHLEDAIASPLKGASMTVLRLSRAVKPALGLIVALGLPARTVADDDCSDDGGSFSVGPTWVSFVIVGVLICMSGLFSGLTLGLLGLDLNGLEIVEGGDDEKNREMARKIIPIRKNGNLLLCTLLLGNVAVNAMLSILLADLTSGLLGFILSTILIVLFGEIMPQASCSRYPLQIGSRTVPLVKMIMLFLLPVTYPLAYLLDYVLGDELGTIYSNTELIKLMRIHEREGQLDGEQGRALEGALRYKDMLVKEVMTPIQDVYMLSHETKLNFKTLREIFQSGFSRVPVHGPRGKDEVIGMLFVKDLIFIDPEDETPVKNFIQILGRPFNYVFPDEKLGDVLVMFKRGQGHMAIVRDTEEREDADNVYINVGIITLEDIVESILGDEIIDETDVYVHMDKKASSRIERKQFDYAQLSLMDPTLHDGFLSLEEVNAVTAHLCMNYRQFQETPGGEKIAQDDVRKMVSKLTALSLVREGNGTSDPPGKDMLYRRGRASSTMTLVLSGRLAVVAGKDGFRSDAGPWTVLGCDALLQEEGGYIPDFTAYIATENVRCIRVSRFDFAQAILKLSVEDTRKNLLEMKMARLETARKRASSSGTPAAALTVQETEEEPWEEGGIQAPRGESKERQSDGREGSQLMGIEMGEI